MSLSHSLWSCHLKDLVPRVTEKLESGSETVFPTGWVLSSEQSGLDSGQDSVGQMASLRPPHRASGRGHIAPQRSGLLIQQLRDP